MYKPNFNKKMVSIHFNANNSFFDQSHEDKAGALCNLKYWNIVVNLRLVPLCNTFSNPYNIAAFLFLELDISVKHSKMELLLKRECVHLNLENITTDSVRYIYVTPSPPQKKLKEGKFSSLSNRHIITWYHKFNFFQERFPHQTLCFLQRYSFLQQFIQTSFASRATKDLQKCCWKT